MQYSPATFYLVLELVGEHGGVEVMAIWMGVVNGNFGVHAFFRREAWRAHKRSSTLPAKTGDTFKQVARFGCFVTSAYPAFQRPFRYDIPIPVKTGARVAAKNIMVVMANATSQ